MRKIFSVISVVLTLAMLAAALNITAVFAESDANRCGENVYYSVNGNGALRIYGKGKMYDYTGNSPFAENGNITSVTVENGVTSVGIWSFRDCKGITEVSLAESVVSIGENAFVGCASLKNISIKGAVEKIGYGVFYGCKNLVSVTLPDTVKEVGERAFSDCKSLKTAELGAGLEQIGNCAFIGCSKLESVTFGNLLKSVGSEAFAYCSALTSIDLSDAVASLGNYVFQNCSSLKTVTAGGNSLLQMGVGCFLNSPWLNLQPNGPIILGGILCGYKGSAVILDLSKLNITAVADSAFKNSSVQKLTVGSNVKAIGNGSFENCTKLKEIIFEEGIGSIAENAFKGCESLKNVDLPDSLKTLGRYAFSGCTSIENATFGAGLSQIGTSPFAYCGSLKAIKVDGRNRSYTDVDGVVYNKEKNILVQSVLGAEGGMCLISPLVIRIDDYELGYESENIIKSGFFIRGYKNTAAEGYAVSNGISFGDLYGNEKPRKKGDLNNDDDITAKDAIIVLRADAEIITLDELETSLGDVTGDGYLSSKDAIGILKMDAGFYDDDYDWMNNELTKEYSSSKNRSTKPSEKYVYKTVGSFQLVVNVYLPKKLKENNATVICLEGSAWNPQNKTDTSWDGSYLRYSAQYFANRGFIGIEVNYRSLYSAETSDVWDCIQDCADGYNYVVNNLPYVNPDKVVLLGESAGGHMALMMELLGTYKGVNPQVVVAMNPTIHLDEGYCLRSGLYKLSKDFEGLKKASPIYNIEKTDARIIITQGSADSVTPAKYSAEFYKKMRECGNDIQYVSLDGQEHSCLLYDYINNDHYINGNMRNVYALVRAKLLQK